MSTTFRITPVPTAVKAAIEADPYFADISVFTEAQKDLDSELDRALGVVTEKAGKVGICCVVLTPNASIRNQVAPGPMLEPLSVVVIVAEDVEVNNGDTGTKKSALSVVEILLRLIHRLVITQANSALLAASRPFVLVENPQGLLQYNVSFDCKLALNPDTTT